MFWPDRWIELGTGRFPERYLRTIYWFLKCGRGPGFGADDRKRSKRKNRSKIEWIRRKDC